MHTWTREIDRNCPFPCFSQGQAAFRSETSDSRRRTTATNRSINRHTNSGIRVHHSMHSVQIVFESTRSRTQDRGCQILHCLLIAHPRIVQAQIVQGSLSYYSHDTLKLTFSNIDGDCSWFVWIFQEPHFELASNKFWSYLLFFLEIKFPLQTKLFYNIP